VDIESALLQDSGKAPSRSIQINQITNAINPSILFEQSIVLARKWSSRHVPDIVLEKTPVVMDMFIRNSQGITEETRDAGWKLIWCIFRVTLTDALWLENIALQMRCKSCKCHKNTKGDPLKHGMTFELLN